MTAAFQRLFIITIIERKQSMDGKENRYLLLQVNDALFPIGGYSHSYGLETYIQKDIIRKEADGAGIYREKNPVQPGACGNCWRQGFAMRRRRKKR